MQALFLLQFVLIPSPGPSIPSFPVGKIHVHCPRNTWHVLPKHLLWKLNNGILDVSHRKIAIDWIKDKALRKSTIAAVATRVAPKYRFRQSCASFLKSFKFILSHENFHILHFKILVANIVLAYIRDVILAMSRFFAPTAALELQHLADSLLSRMSN